jgi:hypothetical protein
VTSRITTSGAVLVERVAGDGERIVHADGFPREELSVPVHREVGREVRERPVRVPGSLEAEALETEQALRPDRLHGGRLAGPEHEACLRAEPAGHTGCDEEQDQPEVSEQRGHLRVSIAIPVQVAKAACFVRAHGKSMPAEDPGDVRRGHAAHRGAVRQARIEERIGLDDPDLVRLPPQARRAVQRANDDRDEKQHEARGEPRRSKDLEHLQAFQQVDDC